MRSPRPAPPTTGIVTGAVDERSTSSTAPTTRGGVGLTNLRERLRLLFGERAALEIAEPGANGARVRVMLPA